MLSPVGNPHTRIIKVNTEERTEWWLAELDAPHGAVRLEDGPHGERSGAEEALALRKRLSCISTEGRTFMVAEVKLTHPTGEHGALNEGAIATLNES